MENKRKYNRNMELLTLVIAGSVDDGKSTLIGRLLYDTGNVYEDQIQAVENTEHIEDELDYSLFTDGLEAEREQKITIDVAYRYFSSNQRTFIIADVPGHEEYTRNMVTGASHSQVALIVIDARKGMTVQTRRHFFVLSLLNIPHVAVVVNKMDMVSYDQGVFENIRDDVQLFTRNIGIKNIQFIPVSALKGDMVATRGNNLLWYFGQTVLEYIHDVPVISSRNMVDARFPVQYVVRPDQDFRGYAGTVAGGVFLVGDNIKVLPSGVESFIEHISVAEEDVSYAFNGQAAVMSFVDQIDVSRGDIVVRVGNEPIVSNNIDAVVFWFNKQPAVKKNRYIIKQTTKETFCFINTVFSVIDVLNGEYQEASQVELNQIGKVRFTTHEPFVFDSYKKNKKLGSFILIDEVTGDTVAAGVITPSEKKMLPDIQEEPLLLDVPKKNITLEEKVELSKKENQLIKLLEERVDDICEREEIIEKVWPEMESFGVSDWAIDRLVARLRNKLKLQKSPYEIVTIKTRGYKLIKS